MIRSLSDAQIQAQRGCDPEPWLCQRNGTRSAHAHTDCILTPRREFIPAPDPQPFADRNEVRWTHEYGWGVHLTAGNGRTKGWYGDADDWADAIERAEKACPGFDVHTAGPDIQGGKKAYAPRPWPVLQAAGVTRAEGDVNPILSAFRVTYGAATPDNRLGIVKSWLEAGAGDRWVGRTEQVADARKVLTKLRDVTEAGK